MGGGFSVVHRLPPAARRLRPAPTLSDQARFRLRCVEHAQRAGAAVEVFGVSRATVYRWRRRYDPRNLTTLEERPTRPHRVRRATWTVARAEAVLALRTRHPRMGKTQLAHLLAGQGMPLSASMVGRILASLRRRRLLVESSSHRIRRIRPARPHATRVPPTSATPPG
ncbi:MAG: helix-turn-helix domain-containing protein, partial [Chloroflexia bacterium]|nr:helix-turn-helix domain-containing protein [Chloroflexia bacterium]